MWIELLNTNFKELLKTLIEKPYIIMIIGLMASTGYFMNKSFDSKGEYERRLDRCQHEKDSIAGIAFDRLLMLHRERDLRELEHQNLNKILRDRLEEPINEIKNVELNK